MLASRNCARRRAALRSHLTRAAMQEHWTVCGAPLVTYYWPFPPFSLSRPIGHANALCLSVRHGCSWTCRTTGDLGLSATRKRVAREMGAVEMITDSALVTGNDGSMAVKVFSTKNNAAGLRKVCWLLRD